jgi:hypothetical protein
LLSFLGGGTTSIRGAVRRTDRQTDRQTDQPISWNVPPPFFSASSMQAPLGTLWPVFVFNNPFHIEKKRILFYF